MARGGGAAEPPAPPAGFAAADVTPILPPSALTAASELWLVQLPPGVSLPQLAGAKLKLRNLGARAAGDLGSVRLSSSGGGAAAAGGASSSSRVRLVAEEASLAAQLFVVPAPCDGAQGARPDFRETEPRAHHHHHCT